MKYPHVMQHDEKDCGAACLSMVSEYYGLKLSITQFRELIGVDIFGSNIYGIEKLPFRYETMLEENGNNLSAGQKQRLAIVRALLKKPDILIMDEATSNLDTITEQNINEIINQVCSEITVIIIAHRLWAVRDCDYIYVMEEGKIKEEGNHSDLLKKKGIYSDYWKYQI